MAGGRIREILNEAHFVLSLFWKGGWFYRYNLKETKGEISIMGGSSSIGQKDPREIRLESGNLRMDVWFIIASAKVISVISLNYRNADKSLAQPGRIQATTTEDFEFNVLLTVHHAMILGNCSTWRTNSFQCIYLFIVLYMFRACRVLVGSKLPTSTRHCHQHGVTITRSCIDTTCFSWWWAWHARNM